LKFFWIHWYFFISLFYKINEVQNTIVDDNIKVSIPLTEEYRAEYWKE